MSLATDYQFLRNTAAQATDELYRGFHDPVLRTSKRKANGSRQIGLDLYVHNRVETICDQAGYALHSEESKNATFGRNNILVLDPVDGSENTFQAWQNNLNTSIAAASLGLWRNGPIAGAAGFPLLGSPRVLYSAARGMGAWREINGRKHQLKIDTKPTRGVVLTTPKQTNRALEFNARLEKLGFTPFPVDGAVFKACAVADPTLLQKYKRSGFKAPKGPIVGFASWRPHFHDVAAVTCIVREAGGKATEPRNADGPQLWAAANNPEVYDLLFGLLT